MHNYKNIGHFSWIVFAYDEYLLCFAYEYIVYNEIYPVQNDLNNIVLNMPIPKQMLAVSIMV